jgi:hypothetical protein
MMFKIFMCLCLASAMMADVHAADSASPYTWNPNQLNQSIPTNFSWGNANGKNYLSVVRNSNVPQYCDASYIFAVTSSLSDRIAVARGGIFPEINMSPQMLLSCNTANNGCNGGDILVATKYIHDNFITEESCTNYQAVSYKEGATCDTMHICKNCNSAGKCWAQTQYYKYQVGEYGTLPPRRSKHAKRDLRPRADILHDQRDPDHQLHRLWASTRAAAPARPTTPCRSWAGA